MLIKAKLDTLWSQRSPNLHELWEDKRTSDRLVSSKQPSLVQSQSGNEQAPPHPGSFLLSGSSQPLVNALCAGSQIEQRSPGIDAARRSSAIPDAEKQHAQRTLLTHRMADSDALPSVVLSAADLERRFLEESVAIAPSASRILSPSNSAQFPQIPSPHNRIPLCMAPGMPLNFGGAPPMPMPPLLPPLHPMMLPFVPFWLELLSGRAPCLPPGCPPVPPLLRMFYDTVKDPAVFMEMIRASNAGIMPPPPMPPPQGHDRRPQWQRKAPGMPSGRTIEDLAFDQFAGYMSCKEREWLVKIQILQCQGTGDPYEDDYYYANWRQKQIAKGWKPKKLSSSKQPLESAKEYDRRLGHMNGSRIQSDWGKDSKDIVPLNVKFAGSLGLPSKSSTSNPRHLISVEHSLDSADEDSSQRAGKQRRLRTLLLRLESALSLLIDCQDIRFRMRSQGQNSDMLLSEISHRIDVIFQDLLTEDLVKILQINKGRTVVARALSVGTPKDVARIVLSLFSVMSLCPKKSLDDLALGVVPSMFNGLMGLSREQLMALSSAVNVDSIKECISAKNVFCRDAVVSLLFTCARRRAIPQSMVRWLCAAPDTIDFVDGWSSPLSRWRELVVGVQDSDVQTFTEWLMLLCDDAQFSSLAKILAKALLSTS